MNYTEKLKNIWRSVYDNNSDVVSVIEKFFDPDYEQCINGIAMHRTEYINHVAASSSCQVSPIILYQSFI